MYHTLSCPLRNLRIVPNSVRLFIKKLISLSPLKTLFLFASQISYNHLSVIFISISPITKQIQEKITKTIWSVSIAAITS